MRSNAGTVSQVVSAAMQLSGSSALVTGGASGLGAATARRLSSAGVHVVVPAMSDKEIRAKLGGPEYELRMATWKMLDYSNSGVRFALNPEGKTIGVTYIPQRTPRVPPGERALIDLRHLRSGPQPAPARPASLRGLKAGAAEVDITPTGEDWLGHKYTVVTPLKSRIVVFSVSDLTVAFVGGIWSFLPARRRIGSFFGTEIFVSAAWSSGPPFWMARARS